MRSFHGYAYFVRALRSVPDPPLHRSLKRGAITLEEAQELVDCVWLRFNDRTQIVRDISSSQAPASNPTGCPGQAGDNNRACGRRRA